ncbi:hypothetical protein NE237_016339 [Protea cynaroides]|uniref:Uncharacterized protein n=1 Tax=Protea cynaroides TaxID=273540 RepID=A0A9Q0JST1_9MAGN|nr:hypothetical protein NE237_016339 [Protea cynaroides]
MVMKAVTTMVVMRWREQSTARTEKKNQLQERAVEERKKEKAESEPVFWMARSWIQNEDIDFRESIGSKKQTR